MGNRKVSSRHVAEAAGVSRTTVSFVLNGRTDVSIPEETRRRVWEAAKALEYAPSPEARALRVGRSAVVLFLLPNWPITGPLGVLLELLSVNLAENGLTMLSHQRSPGEELSQVLAALTPTAIVAMCELTEAEVDLADRRSIDLHAFMVQLPRRPDAASFRQADIGRLQTQALAGRGHTSLAYVSPYDHMLNWFSQPRLEGATQEAARLGVHLTQFRMPEDDEPAVREWLATSVADGVTAVCAYNDEVAFSLLMAANDAGVSVPEHLSLLGVDNTYIARVTRPRLSSISFALDLEASRLAALITGHDEPPVTVKPDILSLQIRDSIHVLNRPGVR